MKVPLAITVSCLLGVLKMGSAAIPVLSPTDEWTPIIYPGVTSDYPLDTQATSLDLDLVGDATHAAFFTRFDDNDTPGNPTDGMVGYRLRMAGNQNPATFAGQAWIGVDVNSDQNLDIFIGANKDEISINYAGPDSNSSPNSTSIDTTPFWSAPISASNYSWTELTSTLAPNTTNFDIDAGGETDYFLTFTIPFIEMVNAVTSLSLGITFDDTSPLGYVAATATQGNTLNSDLNGINGTSGDQSWGDLGAISPEVFVTGDPVVPEPSATALFTGLGVLGFLFVQKRRN